MCQYSLVVDFGLAKCLKSKMGTMSSNMVIVGQCYDKSILMTNADWVGVEMSTSREGG